jgi:hypothetical protein
LCSSLIDLANDRGGPDNVTVVAARFDGAGLLDPDTKDGAGYEVYHVTDQEATDPVPPPPPSPPPEPSPPAPMETLTPRESPLPPMPEAPPVAHRGHSELLIAAALIALIALILTAIF